MFNFVKNKILIHFETKIKLRKFNLYFLKITTLFKMIVNKFLPKKKSEKKLDIIITVAPKDFNKLTDCINSLRKYLLDNISNIYLVAPIDEKIFDIAKINNCIFVDENILLDKEKLNIQYIYKKKDRSNWLYQQFLNYKAVTKLGEENYKLAFNADTIMVCYQKFLIGDKIVFNISNDYHIPYFEIAKNVLSLDTITNFSFTSHHIVYDKTILIEMLQKIERESGVEWFNAIIQKCNFEEFSCHSEFETYGQYYYNYYRHNMILEYWYNLTQNKINNINQIKKKLFCKSISNHHWIEQENK